MGSIAVTAGSVRVRTCAQVGTILKDLGRLAEGMDERQMSGHRRGRAVTEVEIYISGHTCASHASAIDEKIRELGPYAVEAGRFRTEWECEQDHLFVGTGEQVAAAESADALEEMQSLAPKLRGGDVSAALKVIVCDTQMPALKRKYLEKSGGLCPFCESKDISSGPVEADGPVAWSEVECEDCGASWQDVWALIDITEAKDKNGKSTED